METRSSFASPKDKVSGTPVSFNVDEEKKAAKPPGVKHLRILPVVSNDKSLMQDTRILLKTQTSGSGAH